MKTYSVKQADITRSWWLVDADGIPLGRLAVEVAKILRGKNKPIYTTNIDVGDYVIVVNADNKVESRTVKVGQAYKQQWIIKEGLKKGERVIYDGVQKVRPGAVVNIKDMATSAKEG